MVTVYIITQYIDSLKPQENMHITFKVICLLSHSVVDANNTAASSVPALMGPHNPIDIDEKKTVHQDLAGLFKGEHSC